VLLLLTIIFYTFYSAVSVVLVNMYCDNVLSLHFLTNFYVHIFQEEEKKLRSRHSLNICGLDTDYYYREVALIAIKE
jgi:hypothetical protein